MSKVSKSPERFSFQKGGYVKRQEEAGEPISEAYLDMFENILSAHEHKFDDPTSRNNNMEYDLLTTDWILEKVRADDSYAQNLYASMCNRQFQKLDVIPVLKDERWSCSWRYAGGIIADMQQKGDYIDWYCSGISGQNHEYEGTMTEEQWKANTGYVPESVVTDEIRNDLKQLGWIVLDQEDDDR
jgi:hypothetical protein